MYSGNFLGVHQKFNSVAYDHLKTVFKDSNLEVNFPSLEMILHFEGYNGPDGLKLKCPGHDISHFYDPKNPYKTGLLDHLNNHFINLKQALVEGNLERTAWEAAWLAHTIVDGLTPAHHYPYEETQANLRGTSKHQVNNLSDKLLVKTKDNYQNLLRLRMKNLLHGNLNLWGSKGLIMTHGLFELGVILIVKPFSFDQALPTRWEQVEFSKSSLEDNFKRFALRIDEAQMYSSFYDNGWTFDLIKRIKTTLAPLSIKLITLAWQQAILQAQEEMKLAQAIPRTNLHS